VPGHPTYDVFTECLCAESREGNRIHCQYYQEGRGLVALIVYEHSPAGDGRSSGDASAGGEKSRLPIPSSLQALSRDPGNREALASGDKIIYARYLIDHIHGGEKR